MSNRKAVIFDIERNSFMDGPGIRTTVFFKGCNLRCKWCHNPESQSFEKQMMFFKNKCTGCGKCREVCPNNMESCVLCGKCMYICPADARKICGKEYTADEVMKEILKDKAFFENSGGGATFSGGECMLQIDFLEEILKKCKEEGIHTAVDTAGDVPWEYFERIIPYTDLFLYDVKCFTESLHIEGTGVSNKRILNNLENLSKIAEIIIRMPITGGFNNDINEVKKVIVYLKGLNIKNIELLPYHKMGEHKYTALDTECETFSVPADEEMNTYKKLLQN